MYNCPVLGQWDLWLETVGGLPNMKWGSGTIQEGYSRIICHVLPVTGSSSSCEKRSVVK